MKKNHYEDTCTRLENQGWECAHSALYKGYQYSGTVSKMENRDGWEYARVHIGKCHNVRKNGFSFSMQETYVYRRPLEA